MASILTPNQQKALNAVTRSPLSRSFYLTGGTALAEYYLQHRTSQDLDFFSENEFSVEEVTIQLKALKGKIQFTAYDLQTSFNRNIFYLLFDNSQPLKVEFTYFPFLRIEISKKIGNLSVDSLIDIAVNKLFTIAQNPRGRDYFDLYVILQKQKYSLDHLRKLAKQKFDWHVDPLQLGSQLNRVGEFLDDPILITKIDREKVDDFFVNESQKLKNQILTQ